MNETIIYCLARGQTTLENVKANIMARQGQAETRDGIIARLNLLLQDEEFKQIVCGQDTIEINRLIENQESLILDCSGMGTAKKIFVGTLLTNLVKSYFLYSKPSKYQPLILYIDEAHNFLSTDFSIILKEARKYQVSAFLATTDFATIPKPLIHTLLSNVGTIVVLRAGFVEASMIANEFSAVSSSDIKGLPKYHAYCKTPDYEGIVKLPRPIYVKPVQLKPSQTLTRNFQLKWFDLKSYPFHFPPQNAGGVTGDDQRQGSETPPNSTREANRNWLW